MSASAPVSRSQRWARRALTSASSAAVLTIAAASTAMADVPKPVATQPPETEGLNTVLNWLLWGATALCVAGFIISGAMMAIRHRRDGGSESIGSLGWVCTACVVVGAASGLAGGLVG